jgi:hypothetical protein
MLEFKEDSGRNLGSGLRDENNLKTVTLASEVEIKAPDSGNSGTIKLAKAVLTTAVAAVGVVGAIGVVGLSKAIRNNKKE